jgi:hypothetical protein
VKKRDLEINMLREKEKEMMVDLEKYKELEVGLLLCHVMIHP